MPGDLLDPESFMPFHYDPRYDQARNTFEPGAPDVDGGIQDIVLEELGYKLSPEKMKLLKSWLQTKGYFSRNRGDPSFKREVITLVNKLKMAKKVVNAYRSK
jgi:hypothetical protein